jgi:hypothetical protein
VDDRKPSQSGSERFTKPAPPHNRLHDGAPVMCGCVECCREILERRCPAEFKQGRCGNYKGHRGSHTLLIATAFSIAEERVRLDA